MIWEPPLYETLEFAAKRHQYCLVVVVWNEGRRLAKQLERLRDHSGSVDIVIADWRSSDGSTAADRLCAAGVRTRLTTDEGGLGTGIRMGLAYAIQENYAGILTIDGNGKDDVAAIADFVGELSAGFDLIQGSRFLEGGRHQNTPVDRYLGIRLVVAPILSLSAGHRLTDPTNGFRAMSRRYLTDPRTQPLRRRFVRFNLQLYLVSRANRLGLRVKEIPVTRVYPSDGSNPTKITKLSTKLLFLKQLMLVALGRDDP